MISNEDRKCFEGTSTRLAARLQFAGFGSEDFAHQSDDGDHLWAWLASWAPDLAKISIWYGDWFGTGNKSFWVGFQGRRPQIDALRHAAADGDLIDQSTRRIQFKTWNYNFVKERDGIVNEYDKSYDYFGRYCLQSDIDLEEAATEFIVGVSELIKSNEEADIEEIKRTTEDDPTEAKRLINARLGQGQFRKSVEDVWGHRCAVTGCTTRAVLRASHIRPWKLCINREQRLAKHNGLLLSANLDALFDKGLITFTDSGEIDVSPTINATNNRILNLIDLRLMQTPSMKQRGYLRYHRNLSRRMRKKT